MPENTGNYYVTIKDFERYKDGYRWLIRIREFFYEKTEDGTECFLNYCHKEGDSFCWAEIPYVDYQCEARELEQEIFKNDSICFNRLTMK
jgi:hypothetical protein